MREGVKDVVLDVFGRQSCINRINRAIHGYPALLRRLSGEVSFRSVELLSLSYVVRSIH